MDKIARRFRAISTNYSSIWQSGNGNKNSLLFQENFSGDGEISNIPPPHLFFVHNLFLCSWHVRVFCVVLIPKL